LSFFFKLQRRLQEHPSVVGVLLLRWLNRPTFNQRFARSVHPGACVRDAPAALRWRTRLRHCRCLENRALNRAMSKFVSMRLRSGWCAKQTRGCILVRARTTLCLVDLDVARVALHRSAHSRGYKLSKEETDPRSLWGICV
jgi:hypothetical protein